jgi:hypothetical protein
MFEVVIEGTVPTRHVRQLRSGWRGHGGLTTSAPACSEIGSARSAITADAVILLTPAWCAEPDAAAVLE